MSDTDKSKIKNLERELFQLIESKDMLGKSFAEQIVDLEKYRVNRDEVWSNLVDLLDKLDEELFRRICTEYNNQTLREHIEFVRQVNERELNEMRQLGEILPFNDQIEFYKVGFCFYAIKIHFIEVSISLHSETNSKKRKKNYFFVHFRLKLWYFDKRSDAHQKLQKPS